MEQIDSKVKIKRGTDRLGNGQSLKACLPPEMYARYFKCKQREIEYKQLNELYKSTKDGKICK